MVHRRRLRLLQDLYRHTGQGYRHICFRHRRPGHLEPSKMDDMADNVIFGSCWRLPLLFARTL